MRQYTQREFIKICIANGFHCRNHSGSHAIYINDKGKHISIPHNLESVIARRLIRENNLVINIKKRRKMGILSDNLPAGCGDSPDAPWNESLPIKHRRFVSLTISYYTDVEGSPDISDKQIEETIREDVKNGRIPNKFDIDELVILND